MIPSAEIARGLVTGIVAGFASGLLGVSPGGILIPVISIALRLPQHLAQGVSLVAQAPPTSISGISNYARSGGKIPMNSIVILPCGFVAGGVIGAALTKHFNDHQLRWMFVSYLLLLALLSLVRGGRSRAQRPEADEPRQIRWAGLAAIGAVAGISSGLLGIGGGLAITALSGLCLRLTQHQAQALSLLISALPLTLPAAWVYVRQGWSLPWWAIAGIVVGLVAGTKLGAIIANRLPEQRLRMVFTALILVMAIYMGATA